MNKIYSFDKFLNEEKDEKRVYFFHPKVFSDTRAESQSIELINLYFDNPVVYNGPELRGSYYKFVDEVDTIVVLPHPDGTISPRTMRRISYAFDRGVPAYYIHPKKYKIIKIENIEFFEEKVMSVDEWREKIKLDNSDEYFKDNE